MGLELKRLSKIMSERGLCSRREADHLIASGQVYVDGKLITELGSKFTEECRVTLKTEALENQKSLITIMLNKPIGYVSAQPENDYEPAITLITPENYYGDDFKNHFDSQNQFKNKNFFRGLAVTGRLDIDSQGLLLFTQDGRIAKRIIGENSNVEKEYLVRFRGNCTEQTLEQLRNGLSLDNKKLKPARVERLNPDQLKMILQEGKKRQIRRMLELVQLKVTGLKRVRVGGLKLSSLPEGKWRFVSPNELKKL